MNKVLQGAALKFSWNLILQMTIDAPYQLFKPQNVTCLEINKFLCYFPDLLAHIEAWFDI